MKRYRIYTEKVKDLGIYNKQIEAVRRHFSGFTVYGGIGYWNILRENSLIIEIFTLGYSDLEVNGVATELKILGKQDSILVTIEQAEVEVF